ncbi:hypothetical protein [Fusobacterium sp. SYSU M8D902]|uniref:hypothetical protein n=1 Tax=Fusobacterium sp. SYSU M8D902 TaxID=3159562 RepID=UPI0032E4A59C
MWNESNPTSLWLGTTWELISSGKYIQTGNTALQSGGNNSIKIEKTNLPTVKIQLDSFSLGKGNMEITGKVGTFRATEGDFLDAEGAFYRTSTGKRNGTWNEWRSAVSAGFQASRAWTGTTNTAQPQTISLGDGTPLNIQPSYITLKFWKRTS